MRRLRPYLAILRIELKNGLQYRLSAFSQIATNVFWGYVRAVIISVYYLHGSPDATAVPLSQAVSLIWLTEISLDLLPGYSVDGMVWNSIRSGDVGTQLLRPLNLYSYWYARALAAKLVPFLLGLVPKVLVALLIPAPLGLSAPASLAGLGACVLTLITGTLLSCAAANLGYAMCMNANLGPAPATLAMVCMSILAGGYLPLQLWPQSWQRVLALQPFAAMGDLSFRFYAGSAGLDLLPSVLALQFLWLTALIALGRGWIRANQKQIIVQGG